MGGSGVEIAWLVKHGSKWSLGRCVVSIRYASDDLTGRCDMCCPRGTVVLPKVLTADKDVTGATSREAVSRWRVGIGRMRGGSRPIRHHRGTGCHLLQDSSIVEI